MQDITYHIYNDNGELVAQCDNIDEISEYLNGANKKTIQNRISDGKAIISHYMAWRRHLDADGFATFKKDKIIQKYTIEKITL